MFRYFKDKTYRWEINARYNYWTETHIWQSVVILVAPYGLTVFSSFIANSFWPAVFALLWLIPMFFLLGMRQNDVMEKFKYPHDNYTIRNHFMGKWIRRDPHRFVYFKKVDDFHADAHTFETERHFLDVGRWGTGEWNPYKKLENITIHDWYMSGSRLATQEEIENYGLEAIEAKILLEASGE